MDEYKDMEYYQIRALRERELARTSVDASVARIHAEMAERYEQMIESGQADMASGDRVAVAR
ncbi:MAG: hypothetical protein JWL66_1908 [Sphingomonadales bacterium]|nr:hypothetical protein [Sphingomonadales bacterium]